MSSCTGRLIAAAALCAAQLYGQTAPRQIDVGLERAPLTEADRVELSRGLAAHNYAAEKAVIDRATAAHPNSPEIYVLAGRVAYLERHPREAADALAHADRLKPLPEADRLTLALAYEFSRRPGPARAEMVKLIRAASTNAQYYYLLGRLDRQNQSLDQAIADQHKAITLDPNFLKAYQELGQMQEQLGRNDEARKTYEMSAAINRGLKAHWEWPPLDLGALLLKEDQLDAAEGLFRESLGYSPRFSWAHYYLGRVFQQKGKHADAMSEYRAAVVNDPRLKQAWLALGREYTRMGNKAEADRSLGIFKQLEDQENGRKFGKK